jgi:hypothetical protein
VNEVEVEELWYEEEAQSHPSRTNLVLADLATQPYTLSCHADQGKGVVGDHQDEKETFHALCALDPNGLQMELIFDVLEQLLTAEASFIPVHGGGASLQVGGKVTGLFSGCVQRDSTVRGIGLAAMVESLGPPKQFVSTDRDPRQRAMILITVAHDDVSAGSNHIVDLEGVQKVEEGHSGVASIKEQQGGRRLWGHGHGIADEQIFQFFWLPSGAARMSS